YESTFGMKGWIFGWLVGRFHVKPLLSRFMHEHARELKQTIEERAKRSHVFPYRECGTTAGTTARAEN
ncbi:MAG: hypothetical protein ACE5FK_03165, partial [Candidatus Methylomirabilia bacterium]